MQIESCFPGYRIVENKRELFRSVYLEDCALVSRFLSGGSLSPEERSSALSAIRQFDTDCRHRQEAKHAKRQRQRERQKLHRMEVPDLPEVSDE